MTDITIIPHNSPLNPIQVRNQWNSVGDANARLVKQRRLASDLGRPAPQGQIQDNPVPWVKHGAIYLSLFETGENSWTPIVTQLANNDGKRLFTVLTGRHGSNIHLTKPDGQFTGVKDDEHRKQDLRKKAELIPQLPLGSDILVLDVSDPDFNSERRLRTAIRQHVQAGRVVILAWCFSIYAFKGIRENYTSQELTNKHPNLVNLTVNQIIRSDWSPV